MTRVLIVDDEEDARGWLARAFQDLGYETLAACDGYEALHILVDNPTIELLFVDVRLPFMKGTVLAAAGRKLAPDLKVILATGYDPADVEAEDMPLLLKPFEPGKLAAMVHEVVGPP